MRLLHSGRQVGPIPPVVLVLIFVQEVASPRWVFEKRLLVFQAEPRGLGGWGAAVEPQRVPCGFLGGTWEARLGRAARATLERKGPALSAPGGESGGAAG